MCRARADRSPGGRPRRRPLTVLLTVLLTVATLGACARTPAPVRPELPPSAAVPRSPPRSPAPPRTEGEAGPPPARVHRVAPGETAYAIARRYGISVDALARANGLGDARRISVGTELVIPTPARPEGRAPASGEGAGPDARSPPAMVGEGHGSPPVLAPGSPAPPASDAPPGSPARQGAGTEQQDLAAIEAEVHPAPPAHFACAGAGPRAPAGRTPFIWPVDGVVISAFGHRDGAPHEGIDIAAPAGTPIWASSAGEVVFAGDQAGYGRIVIVRHAGQMATVYANNAENCVEVGARVEQGDVIALVGSSGGATSPAVHFEIRVGQATVNPYKHLPE